MDSRKPTPIFRFAGFYCFACSQIRTTHQGRVEDQAKPSKGLARIQY